MAAPTDITGLIHRFRADSVALADAALVTNWAATTGGETLNQATSTRQPTYRTNVVNGKPVVRFAGTDEYMVTTTVLNTQTQPYTISVVMKWNSLGTSSQQVLDFSGNVYLYVAGGGNWIANAGSQLTGGPPTTTGFHVITVTYNGSSATMHIDGSQVASGPVGSNAIPNDFLTMGRRESTDSRYAQMDVAEVVIYSKALSATERQTLHLYVNQQYAINSVDLPQNYTPTVTETSTTSDAAVGAETLPRTLGETSTSTSNTLVTWGRGVGDVSSSSDVMGTPVKTNIRYPLEVSASSDSLVTDFVRAELEDYQFVLVEDELNNMDPWVPWGAGQAISGKFIPGSFDVRDQDVAGVLGDYRMFGTDKHTPPTWAWSLFTDTFTPEDALEWANTFESLWKHPVRKAPERVLAVRYKVGGRVRRVYGRPRRFSRDVGKIQNGKIKIEADFTLAEDIYYDDDQRSVTVPLLGPSGVAGGIILPQPLPWVFTTSAPPRTLMMEVGGSAESWIDIDIYGPCTNPWVKIGDLTYGLTGTLGFGQSVRLSGKPWSMGVRLQDGTNIPGWLDPRSRLSALQMDPGIYSVQFGATDVTGTSYAVTRWRNAHDSL